MQRPRRRDPSSGRTSRRAPPPWPSAGRRRAAAATGAYRSSLAAGRGQRVVARHRREHPGLDLAEVGAHEHVARLGDDARAQVGGHVVQPGRRRHPPGGAVRARPLAAEAAVGADVLVEPARSRTSSRPARPCATSAAARRPGARRAAPRAATPGCRGPRCRPGAAATSPGPGCGGRTRALGRDVAQHLGVAPARVRRPRRPSSAGRGPTKPPMTASRRPGRRAGRRPPARRRAARRPTPTAPWPGLATGRGASARRWSWAAATVRASVAHRASRSGVADHPPLTQSGRRYPSVGPARRVAVVAGVLGRLAEQVERAGRRDGVAVEVVQPTPTPRPASAGHPPTSSRCTAAMSQHVATRTPSPIRVAAVAFDHHSHRGRTSRSSAAIAPATSSGPRTTDPVAATRAAPLAGSTARPRRSPRAMPRRRTTAVGASGRSRPHSARDRTHLQLRWPDGARGHREAGVAGRRGLPRRRRWRDAPPGRRALVRRGARPQRSADADGAELRAGPPDAAGPPAVGAVVHR